MIIDEKPNTFYILRLFCDVLKNKILTPSGEVLLLNYTKL